MNFLCKTPNLKDKKIQELIQKYPVKEKDPEDKNENLENLLAMKYKLIHKLDRKERNKLLKKDLEIMTRTIESIKMIDRPFF